MMEATAQPKERRWGWGSSAFAHEPAEGRQAGAPTMMASGQDWCPQEAWGSCTVGAELADLT